MHRTSYLGPVMGDVRQETMRQVLLRFLAVYLTVCAAHSSHGDMTDAEMRSQLDQAGIKYQSHYAGHLHLTDISDLSHLKGMPLSSLYIARTKVSDLSPLAGMQLTSLMMFGTRVADLSPLKGMPLVELTCEGSLVSDLTPLMGMPLKVLRFSPPQITNGMDVVRQIKTLESICELPAAVFWRNYDLGCIARGQSDISSTLISKQGRPWEGPFPVGVGAKTFGYDGIVIYRDGNPWSGGVPGGGGSVDHWFITGYSNGVVISKITVREFYEGKKEGERAEPSAAPLPRAPETGHSEGEH